MLAELPGQSPSGAPDVLVDRPQVLLIEHAPEPPVTQPDVSQLLDRPFDVPVVEPPPVVLLGLSLPVLPDLPIFHLPDFDLPSFPPAPHTPPGHGGGNLDDLIGDFNDTIESLFDDVEDVGGFDEAPTSPPVADVAVPVEVTPAPVPAPRVDASAPVTTVTWTGDVPQPSVGMHAPVGMSEEVGGSDGERAHKSTGPVKPVKVPAPAPAGGGSAASTGHDHSGGARGAHGVLSAHPPLEPPAGEFTTRGRAADASGRVAGLPATSPD